MKVPNIVCMNTGRNSASLDQENNRSSSLLSNKIHNMHKSDQLNSKIK